MKTEMAQRKGKAVHLSAATAKRLLLFAPDKGWLRAVRKAGGKSAAGLGSSKGTSSQAIFAAEAHEQRGQITLRRLSEFADELGCDLVYALVPRDPAVLEKVLAGEEAMRGAPRWQRQPEMLPLDRSAVPEGRFRLGEFILEPTRSTGLLFDQEVKSLSTLQFRILVELLRAPPEGLSTPELCFRLWGYDDPLNRNKLWVAIRHLRLTLEPDPARPEVLTRKKTKGFKLRYEVLEGRIEQRPRD